MVCSYDELPILDVEFDVSNPFQSAQEVMTKLWPLLGGDLKCFQPLHHNAMHVVEGGITNKLFRVCFTETGVGTAPRSVLLRVFGDGGMIDRVAETKSFVQLWEAGLGPKCYGRFKNGRIEEFYEDVRTLDTSDLQDERISEMIAVQLAKTHKTMKIPENNNRPTLFTQMRQWLVQARSSYDDLVSLENDYDVSLKWLEKRIDEFESCVQEDFAVVFCHNDLLAANILQDPASGMLHFIDFEYGGANYRGFDIANHFNEWAGGTDSGRPDYSKFPREDQMTNFCSHYLRELHGRSDVEHDVAGLMKEVKLFLGINHMYWGLWAINMGTSMGCSSFPYFTFARHRLEQCAKGTQNSSGPEDKALGADIWLLVTTAFSLTSVSKPLKHNRRRSSSSVADACGDLAPTPIALAQLTRCPDGRVRPDEVVEEGGDDAGSRAADRVSQHYSAS
eukprot:750128-Hanusia_phi.AAC.8